MQEMIIGKNEAGQRFDKYLFKVFKEAPASFVYKMLRKKNIVLNDKKSDGKDMLTLGDNVKIYMTDETIAKFRGSVFSGQAVRKEDTAKNISINDLKKYPYKKLDIVYEDEDVIFVNKPTGMLSQKAEPGDISVNEYIIGYLLENGSISPSQLDTFKPSVCNRLDRNTSGLVLAGKSLAGTKNLNEILKERSIKKYYLAVVKGRIEKDELIEGYLLKDERANKVRISKEKKSDDDKYIQTEYKVLKKNDEYSVLLIHLITGRSHQIRAHLASVGHSIIGDPKYGSTEINKKYGIKSQLLHAYCVVLPGGDKYKANPPRDFYKFIRSEEYADMEF